LASFTYEVFDGTAHSAPATVTIDVQPSAGVPPTVESVRINDGSVQRSMVTSLTITFNTVVTYVNGAFRLENKNSGVPLSGWTLTDISSDNKTIVRIAFPAAAGFVGSSLADGSYLLTILAEDVAAAGHSLDGDNNGDAGGNYGFGRRRTTSSASLAIAMVIAL